MRYTQYFVLLTSTVFLMSFSPAPKKSQAPESSPTIQASDSPKPQSDAVKGGTKVDTILPLLSCPLTDGNKDAPVKMIEFSALTCHHCADFQTSILPRIKEKYIDTGKLYFVINDLPMDFLSLEETVILSKIKDSDRRARTRDVMFDSQKDLITRVEAVLSKYRGDKDLSEVKKAERIQEVQAITNAYMRTSLKGAGLSAEENQEIEAYLETKDKKESDNREFIRVNVAPIYDKLKIEGTPTMLIDDQMYSGTRTYEFWEEKIEEALASQAKSQK